LAEAEHLFIVKLTRVSSFSFKYILAKRWSKAGLPMVVGQGPPVLRDSDLSTYTPYDEETVGTCSRAQVDPTEVSEIAQTGFQHVMAKALFI
jgi:hypothetical protein